MSDDHQRGSSKGSFCGVPGTPCKPCNNDYIDVCKPGWATFTFPRLSKNNGVSFTFAKKYEAHHLLCVSPVSSEIIGKDGIDGIVRETVWCVNNKDNMLAMPLWGHYVMHYCNVTAAGGAAAAAVVFPLFQNIPAHDWDHNCKLGYTHEVTEDLKNIARAVEKAQHKNKTQNIAGILNRCSNRWLGQLKSRGLRAGGTHAAWNAGFNNPESHWYEPFSMASSANLTKKGFPVKKFNEKTAAWIKRIATAIAHG